MVFRSVSETERNGNSTINYRDMASSTTVKPHQPLHNFPLQDLKWSMNHNGNSGSSSNHHHQRIRTNKSPHRDAVAGAGKKPHVENSDKKSKIFIRLKTNKSSGSSSKCAVDDGVVESGDQDSSAAAIDPLVEDAEELVPKTWNLRPRRPINNNNNNNKGLNGNGGAAQEMKVPGPCSNRSELTRSNRNVVNGADDNNSKKEKEKEKEKEKKMKFSMTLTKEEIEEDIYSLTGSKPARRPLKRAKHVQKQLDCVFPGMWLASITPDCYKVPEAPSKLRL